jgi:tetratricopeptide (TPR) repeat protein
MRRIENGPAGPRNENFTGPQNRIHSPMTPQVQSLVDEATFEFTMGEHAKAVALLHRAVEQDPACFAAWHALAEIHFDRRALDKALEAGAIAVGLRDDDVHIHTTLSRIWMESGNKEEAEKHGARARVLGWKAQLAEPDES